MSGRPDSHALIYNTILKVKQQWSTMRENIHVDNTQSFYLEKWFAQMPTLQQVSYHNSVCIFLWDILTNEFKIAIDERHISGYEMSRYLDPKGVEFSLANFSPQHMGAIQQMNMALADMFNKFKGVETGKIIGHQDALYRIANGNYIRILQQIVPVETDENGNPFLFLSYVRDITHLKKEDSASLLFTAPNEVKLWKYCSTERVLESVTPFTAKELEILHYLGEGKQTKQIASSLNISPHTIDTHRRNMLAKTNCIDSTALVAYCRLVGLM